MVGGTRRNNSSGGSVEPGATCKIESDSIKGGLKGVGDTAKQERGRGRRDVGANRQPNTSSGDSVEP